MLCALCINLDTTDYMNAIHLVETLIKTSDGKEENHKESFASTLNETIESLAKQIVEEMGKQPATMSQEERFQFVKTLEEKGAFLMKGAVDHLAGMTGVSKYTIYSYLQKIRTARNATANE